MKKSVCTVRVLPNSKCKGGDFGGIFLYSDPACILIFTSSTNAWAAYNRSKDEYWEFSKGMSFASVLPE